MSCPTSCRFFILNGLSTLSIMLAVNCIFLRWPLIDWKSSSLFLTCWKFCYEELLYFCQTIFLHGLRWSCFFLIFTLLIALSWCSNIFTYCWIKIFTFLHVCSWWVLNYRLVFLHRHYLISLQPDAGFIKYVGKHSLLIYFIENFALNWHYFLLKCLVEIASEAI